MGLDTPSTDTRVYWLAAGAQPGERIPTSAGKIGKPVSGGFPFTVERRDRTIYFANLRNGEAENFFGPVIAAQPVDQTLSIQHLDGAGGQAAIEVSLQGVTVTSHSVRVQLNGTDVTRLSFNGQSLAKQLVSVPHAVLREGENKVRLIPEGGQGDVNLVDAIRITYSHSYAADGNALRLRRR